MLATRLRSRLRPCCHALLLAAALGTSFFAHANTQENRANTIFNLLLFVDWPEQRYTEDYFHFCTTPSHPLPEFELYTGRTVHRLPLRLFELNTAYDGLSNCHVIYVPTPSAELMQKLQTVTRNQALLIITEDRRGIQDGAMVNLLPQQNNFLLELNQRSMQSSHLRPHAQLLAITRRQGKH